MSKERPRSHQLEDESKIAFKKCLPSQWVCRDKFPDYGIDAEVEIFDKNDRTTGKSFNVQLKSTDESDLVKALKISLNINDFKYWASFPIPTLIVLYLSNNKHLYCKWAHSKLDRKIKHNQKTTTLTFDPNKYWRNDTAREIEKEIDNYLLLQSGTFSLPLRIQLKFSADVKEKYSTSELSFLFAKESQKHPELFKIEVDPEKQITTRILFSENKTTISIGGERSSFSLDPIRKYKENEMKETLANLMIGAGGILSHFGHFHESSELFKTYYKQTSLLKKQDNLVVVITSALLKTDGLNECRKFFEFLLNIQKDPMSAFSVIMSVGIAKEMKYKESEFLVSLHKSLLKFCEENKGGIAPSSLHYNIANCYFSSSNYRKALKHYCLAKRLDSGYLKRAYFMRKTAGVLFELGKYRFSSRLYKKALELENSEWTRARYADSLMHAGEYKEALEQFNIWYEQAEKPEHFWILKAQGLEYIVDILKITKQIRNTRAAINCTPRDFENATKEDYLKPITMDALWGCAWFNLGDYSQQKKNYKDAFISYLIAATVDIRDISAWVSALFIALREEDWGRLQAILVEGYRTNGEDLIKMIYETIDKQDSMPDKMKDEFKRELLEFLQSQPKQKDENTFTLRFPGNGVTAGITFRR